MCCLCKITVANGLFAVYNLRPNGFCIRATGVFFRLKRGAKFSFYSFIFSDLLPRCFPLMKFLSRLSKEVGDPDDTF